MIRRYAAYTAGGLLVLVALGVGAQVPAPPRPRADLLAWSEGLKLWARQGRSPALELARGVLFECAAYSAGWATNFGPGKWELAGNGSCRGSQPASCIEEAEQAYSRANADPSLVESRIRLAWSRSQRGARDAGSTLDAVLADATTSTSLRYLAAIFRAKSLWTAGDEAAALSWFEKAGAMNADWLSARLALMALRPERRAPGALFTTSPADSTSPDPWFTYQCTLFTPAVRDELAGWTKRVQGES